MSDFSSILVLQIKICIKPDRHGKGSNKIWETLSFWRIFFNNGAIWLQSLICNRLNPRYEMQAVWLSIQRNHPFAYERLFLWRLMHRGCHHSSDVPPLASSDTSHMQCRHDSQSHKRNWPRITFPIHPTLARPTTSTRQTSWKRYRGQADVLIYATPYCFSGHGPVPCVR